MSTLRSYVLLNRSGYFNLNIVPENFTVTPCVKWCRTPPIYQLKNSIPANKHNISATLKHKQGSQPHRHLPTQMQYVQPCVSGQSGRPITTRHREHLRYVRNNSSTSAYATHILDNRHEFGPAEETLKLLKPCSKGSRMDCWESLFIHLHHRHNILIDEQQANDNNLLFELASIRRDLMQPAWHSIL